MNDLDPNLDLNHKLYFNLDLDLDLDPNPIPNFNLNHERGLDRKLDLSLQGGAEVKW